MARSGDIRVGQRRSRLANTNGDLLVNSPDGLPSGQDPIVWWWDHVSSSLPLRAGSTLSAITRATSLICSISSLPWRLLTGGASPGTSIVELPAPRWVLDPMLHRPDGRFPKSSPVSAALRLPRAAFWGQWIRSALLKGVGYLLFEEDYAGAPIAGTLRILNPDLVSPQQQFGDDAYVYRRIGSERTGLWVDTDYDGRFMLGDRLYRLVELLNPTGWVDELGLTRGVLETHAREIGMAESALEYGRGMYRSGVPSGFLKVSTPGFTKERADQLKAQWNAAHGGDRRSTAVLNATTDFTPLSMSPIDMELIASRQASLTDIANAFGVPQHLLGGSDGGSSTYSNAESRNRDFVVFSLSPWANAVEDVLTSLFPDGQWLEVNFNGLLRADTATRFAAYSQALRDGWMTPNEVRLLESLPPLDPDQAFRGIDPRVEITQQTGGTA